MRVLKEIFTVHNNHSTVCLQSGSIISNLAVRAGKSRQGIGYILHLSMPSESALVVLVPEAESLVESFRKRFDPAAANGVPAHVTILFPFKSPDRLTAETIATLRSLFSKIPAFSVSFVESRRFPDFLYLAPVPPQPFQQLTETVVKNFPDTLPYGGEFKEIVPHLTVAEADDPQQMDPIAAEFHKQARGKLPIKIKVSSISLIDNENGQWCVREKFPLSAADNKK
jgi:2'-5' RNA ligase